MASCTHETWNGRTIFCPTCERQPKAGALKSVRLMGAIGVRHSSSEKLAKFWATGDPSEV